RCRTTPDPRRPRHRWTTSPARSQARSRAAAGRVLASFRSDLSGRAEIIGERRTNVGNEQLVDAHPATGELLLVEVAYQRSQRRHAAVDRIVPDLRPEDTLRRFHLVDDPREADRQRIGIVHRLMGKLARPAERMVKADREPGLLLVEARLQHERM